MFVGMPYAFGAGSVPGVMIDQIFISKGTNSVLQGAEGISGQINIIPKTHDASTEKLFLNAFFNSFSESQYNVNYLHRKSKWSNFTDAHLTLPAGSIDRDGDNFNDVVRTNRASIFNKWSYSDPENDRFTQDIGIRFWTEKRIGGNTDFDEALHLGSEISYGNVVDLTQIDLYTRSNFKLSDRFAIQLLNGAYTHDQESYYGNRNYLATQNSFKSDLIFDYSFGTCLLYTSPSPRDQRGSRMPSSA